MSNNNQGPGPFSFPLFNRLSSVQTAAMMQSRPVSCRASNLDSPWLIDLREVGDSESAVARRWLTRRKGESQSFYDKRLPLRLESRNGFRTSINIEKYLPQSERLPHMPSLASGETTAEKSARYLAEIIPVAMTGRLPSEQVATWASAVNNEVESNPAPQESKPKCAKKYIYNQYNSRG